MSERTIRQLTPAERGAYVVWQQKLADRTLPKEQHDHARQEIDKLFRRGPWGMIELLRDELAEFKSRLTSLEEFILSPDPRAAAPPTPIGKKSEVDKDSKSITFSINKEDEVIASQGTVVQADCGNSLGVTQTLTEKKEVDEEVTMKVTNKVVDPTEPNKGVAPSERHDNKPAKETRGRKALRFHPEKDANKKWHILDRESGGGMWTDHGPYKTRREAKEMCDTLNNMPSPPPLRFPPEDSVDVKEEMPDGAPAPAAPGSVHEALGGNSITGPYTAENQEPTAIVGPEDADPLSELGF